MPSLGGAGMASATPAEASSSMQQQDEHQTRGQPALQGTRPLYGFPHGLPPMHSSANTGSADMLHEPGSGGLIGKMPSFHSIKVGSTAHTDPAALLARARSAGGSPAVGTLSHADPVEMLARARG
eukprot:CAMPEP_0179474480 /NCGR_PEP_ID=MMETSP0799-20121207/53911_1 /TAXON_ID=46947 /ORGANISM="Geminigera cryophila, Strain CCMP2564" /LENGTH=124 /DNA_ID=CAMNT_0021283535 /DNA_START=128 /DNA_END=498 /DNA_ORIENTATION=+